MITDRMHAFELKMMKYNKNEWVGKFSRLLSLRARQRTLHWYKSYELQTKKLPLFMSQLTLIHAECAETMQNCESYECSYILLNWLKNIETTYGRSNKQLTEGTFQMNKAESEERQRENQKFKRNNELMGI